MKKENREKEVTIRREEELNEGRRKQRGGKEAEEWKVLDEEEKMRERN